MLSSIIARMIGAISQQGGVRKKYQNHKAIKFDFGAGIGVTAVQDTYVKINAYFGPTCVSCFRKCVPYKYIE